MLNHQLPALLPLEAFWDALPEVFEWLSGTLVPVVHPAFPIAGGALIRERVIAVPTGAPGQSHIEIIRFAAANRLIVELDYRDQNGTRSTRAIEAYSLRRSQAGDVLLMAVREADGQARSYRLDSILGAICTQRSFSPRYPIELSPSGPQAILATSRPTPALAIARPLATQARPRRAAKSGPTYVYRCTVCHRQFSRSSYDATLRPHKNKAGRDCYGRYGTFVRTKY